MNNNYYYIILFLLIIYKQKKNKEKSIKNGSENQQVLKWISISELIENDGSCK